MMRMMQRESKRMIRCVSDDTKQRFYLSTQNDAKKNGNIEINSSIISDKLVQNAVYT